ncbi:MAG: hypothetical protein E4G94_02440, partial [ANME-2 cluster archaeon]
MDSEIIPCRRSCKIILTLLIVLSHIACIAGAVELSNEIGTPWVEEFSVAIGDIPAYPDVLHFNLIPMHNPTLFSYELESNHRSEYLNFSVNGNFSIPAASFRYSTTIYNNQNNHPMISWLGQPYSVRDHSNMNMNISRLLIEDSIILRGGETFSLPEGFALTVLEIDPFGEYKGYEYALFSLTRYGNVLDDKVIKKGEIYEYSMDLNGNGQGDRIIQFTLEKLFHGDPVADVIKIHSLQFISPEIISLRNDTFLEFNLKGSTIAWFGLPYYVVDHNTSSTAISRWLVAENANERYTLEKGDTLSLPDGFVLKVLEIRPEKVAEGPSYGRYGYGSVIFSLTHYAEEVDRKELKATEIYEYAPNNNNNNSNWVLRFNVRGIFQLEYSSHNEYEHPISSVNIHSIQLRSPYLLKVNSSDPIHFISENYSTHFENNGTTVIVECKDDIHLENDRTTAFMNNWFNVRNNGNSVAVSSIKTSSSDSKFIGVFKDLYSYPATFNLTSRNNPDLLWYDLDEKAG